MQILEITIQDADALGVEFEKFLTIEKISLTTKILLERFGINFCLLNEAHLLLSTLKENRGLLKDAVHLNVLGLTEEDNQFLSKHLECRLNNCLSKEELFILSKGTPFSDRWGNFALELFWIEKY